MAVIVKSDHDLQLMFYFQIILNRQNTKIWNLLNKLVLYTNSGNKGELSKLNN